MLYIYINIFCFDFLDVLHPTESKCLAFNPTPLPGNNGWNKCSQANLMVCQDQALSKINLESIHKIKYIIDSVFMICVVTEFAWIPFTLYTHAKRVLSWGWSIRPLGTQYLGMFRSGSNLTRPYIGQQDWSLTWEMCSFDDKIHLRWARYSILFWFILCACVRACLRASPSRASGLGLTGPNFIIDWHLLKKLFTHVNINMCHKQWYIIYFFVLRTNNCKMR